MKNFLLIFRRDVQPASNTQLSAEQMQALIKPWQGWMGGLAAQNKLSNRGNQLASEGKVVKPGNVVVNGPFVELKEAIGGYIMVSAKGQWKRRSDRGSRETKPADQSFVFYTAW
jgi:hypothetical protein